MAKVFQSILEIKDWLEMGRRLLKLFGFKPGFFNIGWSFEECGNKFSGKRGVDDRDEGEQRGDVGFDKN